MDKPKFRFINKPKRKRWFSVYAKFEFEDNIERAKFRHAGDAYSYASNLVNKYKTFAVPLLEVRVEC